MVDSVDLAVARAQNIRLWEDLGVQLEKYEADSEHNGCKDGMDSTTAQNPPLCRWKLGILANDRLQAVLRFLLHALDWILTITRHSRVRNELLGASKEDSAR